MPVASCDKEYAPGGHAGSQPARAAERSGQRVARAAGRHGAERRAVLAARRRHADGRRSGTGVRRPQVLYRAGRPHARGQRHRAALDQLGHGVRPAVEQAASHGPLVRDGRISAVGWLDAKGARGPTGRKRAETVVRDCTGCLVMPGLIQAHVHLCQTLFRGLGDDLRLEDWLARRIWPLEAAHTEETVYWSALLGAAELLLGGTTAILDMETVHHTGAAFEALERSGIRATAGKCLMDAHPEGAPLELAESTDAALAEAESLARRWHGAAGGRLRWCFAHRFVPSCSGPLLRAASDLAERHGAQLHTHAAETIVERETVLRTTGLEEIAYLDSVGIAGPRAALAHCVWVDQHEIARLAAQGTNVVHCPSSNLKLGSGVARIPEMLQAGCRVALGSDGAACNNRLDAFPEMRLAALIQKPRHGADVLSAGQVLELATAGGARALGLEQELGAIAVGRRADLVVLDLRGPHLAPTPPDPVSHLVYAAQASDVRDVFVGGRPVVPGGELVTVALDEILREAGRCAAELRRRAGLG